MLLFIVLLLLTHLRFLNSNRPLMTKTINFFYNKQQFTDTCNNLQTISLRFSKPIFISIPFWTHYFKMLLFLTLLKLTYLRFLNNYRPLMTKTFYLSDNNLQTLAVSSGGRNFVTRQTRETTTRTRFVSREFVIRTALKDKNPKHFNLSSCFN